MGLFTKDIKTMNDLFVHQLQDIYYAEQQIVKALPKMADKATDKQLKQGFLTHLDETKVHVQRLEPERSAWHGSPRFGDQRDRQLSVSTGRFAGDRSMDEPANRGTGVVPRNYQGATLEREEHRARAAG